MLALNSEQAQLAQRPSVACVPLVVVETFSDKDAGTVASTFYWSRGTPLNYEWDGATAVQFWPRLLRVAPISRGFDHLPNATTYATRDVLELVVDGSPRADAHLWKQLLALNLIGARVTVGSLLVDLEGVDSLTVNPWALAALGAVHVVRWRGEITNVPEFDDDSQTITLTAESREFILSQFRRLLAAPRARLDDLGKRFPMIVGSVRGVRGLWYAAGKVATLLTAETNVSTTWNVSPEFLDFLTWYGTATSQTFLHVLCGDEVVSMTAPTASGAGYDVTVVRGLAGTTAVAHDVGELVFEIPAYVELAMSSGGGYSLDGNVYYSRAGADPVALETLSVGGTDLQTDYTESQFGRVALLQLDNHRRVLAAYAPVNADGFLMAYPDTEVRADLTGEYTVGSWTSRLAMSGDSANWPARDVQNFPAAGQSRAAVAGGVQFGFTAAPTIGTGYQVRAIGPLSIANSELRITLNLTSAELANLVSFTFGVNLTNVIGSVYYPAEQITVYASRLEAGDNELRMNVRVSSVTQFVFCARFRVWTANASFRVTGDIESAPVTVLGSHPAEVAQFVVDDLVGSADLGVDATTFSQVQTDVPTVAIAADLASLGNTVGEVLAEIGFNGRINFLLAEGASQTVVKALSATTSYAFPAVARALGAVFRELRVTPRSIAEIANRFSALFEPIIGGALDDPESYAATLEANEVKNDLVSKVATANITASQTAFGVRESDIVPLTLLSDLTSAVDVMGYYAAEALRGQVQRYSLVAPWWLAYDLEPGDIVSILPRWETSPVKCRVTRVVFDFDRNGVGLNLEAVT